MSTKSSNNFKKQLQKNRKKMVTKFLLYIYINIKVLFNNINSFINFTFSCFRLQLSGFNSKIGWQWLLHKKKHNVCLSKSQIFKCRNPTDKYGKQALPCQSICNCHKQFMETGKVLYKLRTRRPRTSEEDFRHTHQSFQRPPSNSIYTTTEINNS